MTHLTKTLLISATSIALSGNAFANTDLFQPSNLEPDTLVTISKSDITEAQTVFDQPLNLNVSKIDVDVEGNDVTGKVVEYSDELDLDYNLTDEAFIGIADIHEDAPTNVEKGGFPEGRHLDTYNTVAGGGIKTKF